MSLRVDLKSQEVRRSAPFDYSWIFVVVVVVIAFLACYSWGLRLQKVADDKKKELEQVKQKVAGFAGIQGRLDALKREIGSIQSQITQLRELRYDPLRYSILLVRLSQLLPANLWLGSLGIEPAGNKITFGGNAIEHAGHPPLASIAEFIMNLQNDRNNYFSNVVLQSTQEAGKTGETWTFSMTANYNVPLIAGGGTPIAPPKPAAPAPQTSPPAKPGGIQEGAKPAPSPAAGEKTAPSAAPGGTKEPAGGMKTESPGPGAKGGGKP